MKIAITILLFVIELNRNDIYNSFYLVPIYRILIDFGEYDLWVYAISYLKIHLIRILKF